MPKKITTFDHGDTEERKRKAYERLGTDSPKCFCGESNPLVLELHHVAGQRFGNELMIVCRNHDPMLSDAQKDHPPTIPGCYNPLESLAHLLLGIADTLKVIVDLLYDAAARLIEYVKSRSTGSDAEAGQ